MSSPRKIYWDSSCFICFLNHGETARRLICEDVLRQAELGNIELWISTWVIVEVVRPRKKRTAPLPPWALKAIKAVPEAKSPLEELWARFQRFTPTQKLTPEQLDRIQAMFEWPFLKKIYVDEPVAEKAVELARDCGLRPADAVHAASAIISKCDILQKWDRDFEKVKHLIPVGEPQMMGMQYSIPGLVTGFPTPEDFEDAGSAPPAEAKIEDIAPEPVIENQPLPPSSKSGPSGSKRSKSKTLKI